MPRFLLLFFLLGFALAVPPAEGVEPFLTPKGGTLGIGVDQGFIFSDYVKGRLNVNGMRLFFRDAEISDVEYDMDVDIFTFGGLLDLHPAGGSFRVSAGVYYNGASADMDGSVELTQSYEIGPVSISGSLIGDLDGKASYDPFTPYVGIGWGMGSDASKRWNVSIDAGVMYLGKAHVSLRSPLAVVQPLVELVEEEERNVERELNRYRWYPVLMAGLSYRF